MPLSVTIGAISILARGDMAEGKMGKGESGRHLLFPGPDFPPRKRFTGLN